MSGGRNEEPITTNEIESLPGQGSQPQEIYDIVPGSVTILQPPTKRDARGCLFPESPMRELKLEIKLPDNKTRLVRVNWPMSGVSRIRTNPASYQIKHTVNAADKDLYEIIPKPGETPGQALASQQTLNPFRRRGVTAHGDVGIDVFGELGSRMARIRRKMEAARYNAPLDSNMDDRKMTKLGDAGYGARVESPDLEGEDEGDPVAIDNPLDRGVARIEIAIGDAFSIIGDQTGFKNVSKIIKNAIDPHSMQWADWLVNPLTKFLPSTAVVPLKTWIRAIAPSALMLGMITMMKHALKDVKAQIPPGPQSRIGILRHKGVRTDITANTPREEGSRVGGVLGTIEGIENTIRG